MVPHAGAKKNFGLRIGGAIEYMEAGFTRTVVLS
jgi:hypothetical protein